MTLSRQKILLLFIVCFTSIISVSSFTFHTVVAIQYHIDKEWAVVWINEDASIDLLYNITITYEDGGLGYITLGLPAGGFDITSVKDLEGTSLTYDDLSSGSYYAVEVYFGHPMDAGDSDTVILVANIPNMVYEDTMNPGNVGMQFIPTFFEDAEILNLRVAIVPPSGVTEDEIKTSSQAFFTTIDGEFAVFWERSDLAPNTQLTFGVSFPEEYVTLPAAGPDLWLYLTIVAVILAVIGIILLLRRRKETYEKPRVMIEALGPRRGLTAVEAAVVVDTNPAKVLSMILFGLLIKGLVTVTAVEPIINVSQVDSAASEVRKRYYEIDFLKGIEPNGSLNEQRLARTYLSLRDNVDKKMRGYSRADTVNYYTSIVDRAWQQVTQASTPQLKEDVIEQNLQWLLVDEKYQSRFREAFPPNIVILPRPHWYWYWHGPSAPGPRPSTPTTPAGPPRDVTPIPAQEFADNIVSGLEKATNNLVKDVENFTNRLIPSPRTAQSRSSVRSRSRCVCACAACACACACVSCACACAGGGAR